MTTTINRPEFTQETAPNPPPYEPDWVIDDAWPYSDGWALSGHYAHTPKKRFFWCNQLKYMSSWRYVFTETEWHDGPVARGDIRA